jgi:cobalt-zinc-cadmium efflux system protein
LSDNNRNSSAATIGFAFWLNLVFTAVEIIGGLWTNSLAIISDALHDLGDSFSLGLSWYLDKYAEKGRDEMYSYGYRRFSLLGALVSTIVLVIGSIFVLSEAVPRLLHPQHPKAKGMILFAVLGIAINGLAVLRVRKGRTMSTRVVMWHLVEDVLGWGAVLFVGAVLTLRDVPILDPILSMVITMFVLFNVMRNLKRTMGLFLQAVPGGIVVTEIEEKLLAIDKVKSVHHTHAWSLDGVHNVLTTHLVVDDNATKEDVLKIRNQVRSLIDTMDFEHTTVEIGYENEYCRMKER